MKYTLCHLALCSCLLFGLTACLPKPEQPVDGDGDGLALLYSVSSQEANVDKLLWVKDPGPEIEAWVKDIAAFNTEVTQQLKAWNASGLAPNLSYQGLPPAEQVARERATSRTTGELLFSKDVDLRVALVVAQLKAMGYCADLCYAVSEENSHPEIQKVVDDWQTHYIALNETGMKILEVGMSTQPDPERTTEGDESKVRPPQFPAK